MVPPGARRAKATTLSDLTKIELDPRHKNSRVLYNRPASFRTFPRWNMNMTNLDDRQADKYDELVEVIDDHGNRKIGAASPAVTLLKYFKKGVRHIQIRTGPVRHQEVLIAPALGFFGFNFRPLVKGILPTIWSRSHTCTKRPRNSGLPTWRLLRRRPLRARSSHRLTAGSRSTRFHTARTGSRHARAPSTSPSCCVPCPRLSTCR